MRGPIRSALVVAGAVAGCLLAFGAGSAMAVNVLTASGGMQAGGLRDDLTTPPSNGNYGADLLASNKSGLQWTQGGASQEPLAQNPQWDVLVGLKLNSNPVVSETTCSAAAGYVEFADFQGTTHMGASFPFYADTLTRWRVTINSANTKGCTEPGVVTISGVGLYNPVWGSEVTGTIIGVYAQPGPGAPCAAGGVQLNLIQRGLLANGANVGLGFDNGVVGANAFLCFVSSDNYVYPSSPTGPGALTGSIASN
jgi:hypothetical protein